MRRRRERLKAEKSSHGEKKYYSAPGHHGNFATPFWTRASLSDLGQVTPSSECRFPAPRSAGPACGIFPASCTRPAAAQRGVAAGGAPCPVRRWLPGPAALRAPSRGPPGAAARASPRGARPEVTQPAGPLTRACTVPMAPSPTAASQSCWGPTKARLVRAEGGCAAAELPVSEPHTSPGARRAGGGHDAPP